MKLKQQENITAIYCRLSKDDEYQGDSMSIQNQVVICKGWFLPSNTYDCGSFVVNRKAVIGKENITAIKSARKELHILYTIIIGACAFNNTIKSAGFVFFQYNAYLRLFSGSDIFDR